MELTGNTHLYAILGHPVGHIRAPVFFNEKFAALGLDAHLVVFHLHPDELADVVPLLPKVRNLRGLIVTIPHKPAMAELCDELGPSGRMIGTVNTVRFEPGGRLVGDMFDGLGLIAGARANGFEMAGKRVLLVGAGGAGRAIAFAIAQEGAASPMIANRTAATGEAVAAQVAAAVDGADVRFGPADPADHDVIVNATSLGLHDGDPMPVDPDALTGAMEVIDIIAPLTPFQTAVAARGIKLMGGRPMIDHQIEAQMRFMGEEW